MPPEALHPGGAADWLRHTDYAVSSRYPGEIEPITEEEYKKALRLAERVVNWATECTSSSSSGTEPT